MSGLANKAAATAGRDAVIAAAVDEARARPIVDVAHDLAIAGLVRDGSEFVAPCPVHGGKRDKLSLHVRKNIFLCRGDNAAGDTIELVRHVKGIGFIQAVEWLTGGLPDRIDPAEQKRRAAKRAAAERRAADDAEKYRQWAINDARKIWLAARGQPRELVRAYLATRGLTSDRLPDLPADLRLLPDHPYVRKVRPEGSNRPELVTMHRGPCMIAAARAPNGQVTCAHQTWIDPAAPHGKASIEWEGTAQNAKLTRGSQMGAAIRLITPARYDTLVLGEGIETTLTAAVAWPAQLGDSVAYWAGISLGHMAGRMRKVPGVRYSGLPAMDDEKAFFPPPWITRMILIEDGDSDRAQTRAKLQSCARRAMARNPSLKVHIVRAGEGVDLNDVLTAGLRRAEDAEGSRDA